MSRKHIIECVKASLQRLQLQYIDIVIVHKADAMCPMEGDHFLSTLFPLNGWGLSFDKRIIVNLINILLFYRDRTGYELCYTTGLGDVLGNSSLVSGGDHGSVYQLPPV